MTLPKEKTSRLVLFSMRKFLVFFLLLWVPLNLSGQTFRETKLIATDGRELDLFGRFVAVSGEYAAVGAAYWPQGTGYGSVYLFRRTGNTWSFSQKLVASDGGQNQGFCVVVFDGDYLAVGSPGAFHDSVMSGAVYIFKRIGSNWVPMRKLVPNPLVSWALFGRSLALKHDKLLVGADWDVVGGIKSGSAYVFVRNGEDWNQQARLFPSDQKEGQWFGSRVSLWDTTALIGAPDDSNKNGEYAGAAYVFEFDGTTWLERAKLIRINGSSYDLMGDAVSLNAEFAAVGVPGSIYGDRAGAVVLFRRDKSMWLYHSTIRASDGFNGNAFGISLALGNRKLIVGAHSDSAQGVGAGAVYLFTLVDSIWLQSQKLMASDGVAGANYGSECAIADTTILVGAPFARIGGVLTGAAYVYDPGLVGVTENEQTPINFKLHQNFPNPFNPSTVIRYHIPVSSNVNLKVYNLLGQEVATLVNEQLKPGSYKTTWVATGFPSGVYFYRLFAGELVETKKLILSK